MIYPISFIICSLIAGLLFPSITQAENLKSPTFEIQMSNINMTGGAKSSNTYRLTDTVGQTFQGKFESNGYVILAGFQYINTLIPFSFKISDLSIDFGSLVPGTPKTLSNTLTVTTGSAFGYSVRTIEDHPLRHTNGTNTIPDTACDTATPCTPSDANIWSDPAIYGFGYNMQGTDVNTTDFASTDHFRPFAIGDIDDPAIVMSRDKVATASSATVYYKINVSDTQAAGDYENALQFIAIPSF